MLTSIRRIRGAGVYADYSQPAGTVPFSIKNIIYGWNYSGKTTLSRVLAHLEHRATNPDLPDCKFNIETDTGTITEENLHTSDHIVRVFNSDFVNENLNFTGTEFKPILLLGAESEAAQTEIDRLDIMQKRAEKAALAQQAIAAGAKRDLDRAKTEAAATIKKTMSLTAFFGATQLDKEIEVARLGGENYILEATALEADLKLSRTSDQDALPPLSLLVASPMLAKLREEAAEALARKPDMANAMQYFVDHPDVETWVERGLPLHEGKSTCEFCASPLHEHRLEALRAHFSKDQSAHKQALQSLISKVISNLTSYVPRKKAEFIAQCRAKFTTANDAAIAASARYDQYIRELHDALEAKLSSPFVSRALPALTGDPDTEWLDAVQEVNTVVDEHNKIADHFAVEKAKSVRRVKLHYAQEFVERAKVDAQEALQKRCARRKSIFERCSSEMAAERRKLQAVISHAQKGREEINKRIESLLGADSVQISVVKKDGEDRFRLTRRDGKAAKHLSEGLSEFLCSRRWKTCPRRRASLATNDRRGGQVGATS